ncbi:MAG: SGNH/GDSL hydrolase family protein [Phycisphaerales bacterium]|nr:SGNH/GDSL hydrolase family protein [Phycisphaerales bacterium]
MPPGRFQIVVPPCLPLALALGAGSCLAQPLTPLREDVGPGSNISNLIKSGDCRLLLIGDSISNRNTDTPNQSSMYWGIIRRWSPDRWVGICTPTNAHGPTTTINFPSGAAASTRIKSLSNVPGQREFSYGYERFSGAPTVDALWFADSPPGRTIAGTGLGAAGQWRDGDWFAGVDLAASFIVLRTPEGIPSVRMESRRGVNQFTGDPTSLAGPVEVVQVPAPLAPAGGTQAEFRILAEGGHNEGLLPNHLLWLTTRIYAPGQTGFQLDTLAVGGSRLRDWLANGDFASDTHLREYLAATGNPNLIMIQLGANDGGFDIFWKRDLERLINRFASLSQANGADIPYYLLVTPYGTLNSIRHFRVLDAAQFEHEVAVSGTDIVAGTHIGHINVPGILNGPIDQALLVDNIHPRPEGADFIASLLWQAISDEVYDGRCVADMTGTNEPSDPHFGVPDGLVDATDFFYFLDRFVENNLARADLSGSADPNDPAYGLPDGAIDSNDFFYYLDVFVEGC